MAEYMKLRENFHDPTPGHYEDEFEFKLWNMIRDYAEKNDVSYSDAAAKVVHEYSKETKCRDVEWADRMIAEREAEGIAEVQDSNRELNKENIRNKVEES